jgi:alanine dehydrogenase
MALLLTDDDVRRLLSMRDAIEAAELAVRELHEKRADNLPRHHFYSQSEGATFFMRHFQGALPKLGVAGLRVTTDLLGPKVYRPDLRPFGAFLLFDLRTAALLAVVHDHELQRMRVGAETGVAARHLARTNAKRVGLLGSGFQAETQLSAVCAVREIESVDIYSPNAEHRTGFARLLRQKLGISITPVATARQCVEGKDLILASTNSVEPVLDGSWIAEGAHVTSIVNSDQRFRRRELDNGTFARAALIAVGTLEQTRHDRAADIFEAVEAGALAWNRVCELGDVVIRRHSGRENDQQITVFKNNGLAVEFVALAFKAYEIARSRDAGEEIPSRYFSGVRALPK